MTFHVKLMTHTQKGQKKVPFGNCLQASQCQTQDTEPKKLRAVYPYQNSLILMALTARKQKG